MFDQIIAVSLNPSLDVTLWMSDCDWEEPNRCTKEKIYAGGKALNVSRVLKNLTVPFRLVGLTGTQNGQMLTELLNQDGVDYQFIANEGVIRENITLMFPEGRLLKINRAGMQVSEESCGRLLELVRQELKPSGNCLVVFAGSVPPNITKEKYCSFIRQVQTGSVKIALDSDFLTVDDITALRPYIIKPNYCEAKRMLGDPNMGDKKMHQAMLKLSEYVAHILLSCDKNGLLYYRQGKCRHFSLPAVEIRSTIGAGDTTLAGFIAALHNGCPEQEAAAYAVACGTASVTLDGTEAITPDLVAPYLKQVVCREI